MNDVHIPLLFGINGFKTSIIQNNIVAPAGPIVIGIQGNQGPQVCALPSNALYLSHVVIPNSVVWQKTAIHGIDMEKLHP